MNKFYQAAVIGAGPIGAALALSLAKIASDQNRILLLDAGVVSPRYDPTLPDTKVFALNAGSQSLLTKLGVWDAVASARCQPYNRMHVWDANGTGSIEFDACALGESHLGHIVEANLIQATLLDQVAKQTNIEIVRPETVVAIQYEASQVVLNMESGVSVRCELVCAADGANSSLRAMQHIPVTAEPTGQTAIVANIAHELPNESCAWQIFHSTGPLAFLPLADHAGKPLSSIVWSLDHAQAESRMAMSDTEFERSLERAIEEKFGRLSLASKRYSFPLVQRHARDYVKQGFALVGDAAHSIHPLAGLGANIGFQDVGALSAELARASERRIRWGDEKVLRRYQRARKLENQAALLTMKGFKMLFGATEPSVSALRNLGLRLADKSPFVKRAFIRQAMMASENTH